MALITNYASLQTAVGDYLARDDLSSYIVNFIQNAENKLNRTLNLRNEETALSVTVTGGVGAVPTDFKALKFAYLDASPVYLVQWVPIEELYRDYPDRSETGYPALISREGANFVFGPTSIDGTLKGIYYAKAASLRTTDPSWMVTNAPEVLLYGALLESAPFLHDDARLQTWQAFYNDAVQTLKDEQMNSEHSFGQLVQRVS